MADDIKTQVIVEAVLQNKDFIAALAKQEKAQNKANESTEEAAEVTENLEGALDGMLGQIGLSTSALKGMGKTVQTSIKGFKGLKVALASTGIGLLVVALGSLIAWFNRTKEGQETLTKITAGFGAAIDVLLDTLAGLGETLFNAFNDPKQAVIDLGNSLQTYVLDAVDKLLDGFGLVGRAITKALSGDFSGAFEDAAAGMSKIVDGATDLNPITAVLKQTYEGVVVLVKEINEETTKAVSIQGDLNKLNRDKIAFLTREARLQVAISEEKLKSQTAEGNSDQERLEASEEAIRLTRVLQTERASFLIRERDALIENQALGLETLEDTEELANIQREIILLGKEQADALGELVGQRQSLLDSIAAEKKARLDLIESARIKEEERSNKAVQSLADEILARNTLIAEERLEDTGNYAEYQESLLAIEEVRFANELAAAEHNKAELELLEFKHTQNVLEINKAADKKDAELKKVKFNADVETINATTDVAFQGLEAIFGESKAIALSQAVINGALGVTKTIANVGLPLAIPLVAAQGVLLATQISNIQKAERGLYISGKRHSEGGTLVEAEDGEVIINRNSTSMFRDLLSDINVAGGGIPLAQRGIAIAESSGRSIAAGIGNDITTALATAQPVLVLEDLQAVENRLIVTESLSTF